jgi:hypothetical protein
MSPAAPIWPIWAGILICRAMARGEWLLTFLRPKDQDPVGLHNIQLLNDHAFVKKDSGTRSLCKEESGIIT